jgi:hypothetical protein
LLDEKLFREAISDRYYRELLREFKILRTKYSIQPMNGWVWKFSRLRPANFPTIRISQLASMFSCSDGLFTKALEVPDVTLLKSIFEVTASEYWSTHFVFGKKSRSGFKKTGSQATDILLINAVIPLIFVYGMKRDRQDICEKALSLLENIKGEDNILTNEW